MRKLEISASQLPNRVNISFTQPDRPFFIGCLSIIRVLLLPSNRNFYLIIIPWARHRASNKTKNKQTRTKRHEHNVCSLSYRFESRKPTIIRYRIISSSYDSCNVLLAGKAGDVMNESTGSPSSCLCILNFFVHR